MIGRRLGHFEILEKIGEGAMGAVYRARDLDLHRTVAVKILPPAKSGDERRRRFLAEARAASALNHPSIVTIHEIGADDGIDFIAMELVGGESLAARLARGPLAPEEVRRLGLAIARALARAHEAGIVHRDLKPANVMVAPTGEVKILDFGLAKRRVEPGASDDMPTVAEPVQTEEGVILGTPAYMAPEQARGEGVDARADLFSLGRILHEMLTGTRPFGGASPLAVLSAILRDEPPRPSAVRSSVPQAWDGLVGRLLAKDRAQRTPSAAVLVEELEGLGQAVARRAGLVRSSGSAP